MRLCTLPPVMEPPECITSPVRVTRRNACRPRRMISMPLSKSLEMTVRPASALHVLELAAKGTIRNKEVFNRNYFETLQDVDLEKFLELVDVWVVEYAESYAAKIS